MTLHEAIGVSPIGVDPKTGERLEFSELVRREIEFLGGLKEVRKYIPFSLAEIREKLKKDVNLNNTPLSAWDEAAGFRTGMSVNAGRQVAGKSLPIGGGITALYYKHGITSYSCSDGVCILKEAARMLAEVEK